MYIFSYIMIFMMIIFSFMNIYLIKNSRIIKGKKYVLLSLYVFSLWFLIEMIRFLTGFGNEYIAARIWSLSHIGTIFTPLFLS